MVQLPTDDWERGYAAGWRAAQTDVVRDVTVDMGRNARKSPPSNRSKKKRKPSKYNLEYKKQYAKLRKKHPRTSFSALAKKAHAATKRAMK